MSDSLNIYCSSQQIEKKNLNMLYVVRGETIRVPGSQCGLANEHTSVTAVVKEGKSPFSSFKSLVSIRPFTRTGRHCHNLYLLCSHTLGFQNS